jgi:nucleoside-diphosphate-sugar epimerase
VSRTLVTGAPGWLGNTLLTKLIEKERSIRLLIDPIFTKNDLGKLLSPIDINQLEIVFCDLRDPEGLAKVTSEVNSVFHVAAAQHPRKVSDIYAINTEATGTLAMLAAKAGVEKFVFVSSGTVQGVNANDQPTNELIQSGKLYTHYSLSKLQAEALLRKVSDQSGLNVVFIRPGVFYGTNPSPNMQRFMSMIQQRPMPIFGKDGYKRTYADITKVADALLLAEQHGRNGQAYIAADLGALSTREVYEAIANGLGCQPRVINVPTGLARLAEASALHLGRLLDRHFTMLNIIGEFARPSVFSSLYSDELGLKPLPSSYPGLKEMASGFRKSQLKAKKS